MKFSLKTYKIGLPLFPVTANYHYRYYNKSTLLDEWIMTLLQEFPELADVSFGQLAGIVRFDLQLLKFTLQNLEKLGLIQPLGQQLQQLTHLQVGQVALTEYGRSFRVGQSFPGPIKQAAHNFLFNPLLQQDAFADLSYDYSEDGQTQTTAWSTYQGTQGDTKGLDLALPATAMPVDVSRLEALSLAGMPSLDWYKPDLALEEQGLQVVLGNANRWHPLPYQLELELSNGVPQLTGTSLATDAKKLASLQQVPERKRYTNERERELQAQAEAKWYQEHGLSEANAPAQAAGPAASASGDANFSAEGELNFIQDPLDYVGDFKADLLKASWTKDYNFVASYNLAAHQAVQDPVSPGASAQDFLVQTQAFSPPEQAQVTIGAKTRYVSLAHSPADLNEANKLFRISRLRDHALPELNKDEPGLYAHIEVSDPNVLNYGTRWVIDARGVDFAPNELSWYVDFSTGKVLREKLGWLKTHYKNQPYWLPVRTLDEEEKGIGEFNLGTTPVSQLLKLRYSTYNNGGNPYSFRELGALILAKESFGWVDWKFPEALISPPQDLEQLYKHVLWFGIRNLAQIPQPLHAQVIDQWILQRPDYHHFLPPELLKLDQLRKQVEPQGFSFNDVRNHSLQHYHQLIAWRNEVQRLEGQGLTSDELKRRSETFREHEDTYRDNYVMDQKRYAVLDTNFVINYGHELKRLSNHFKLVFPRTVLEELDKKKTSKPLSSKMTIMRRVNPDWVMGRVEERPFSIEDFARRHQDTLGDIEPWEVEDDDSGLNGSFSGSGNNRPDPDLVDELGLDMDYFGNDEGSFEGPEVVQAEEEARHEESRSDSQLRGLRIQAYAHYDIGEVFRQDQEEVLRQQQEQRQKLQAQQNQGQQSQAQPHFSNQPNIPNQHQNQAQHQPGSRFNSSVASSTDSRFAALQQGNVGRDDGLPSPGFQRGSLSDRLNRQNALQSQNQNQNQRQNGNNSSNSSSNNSSNSVSNRTQNNRNQPYNPYSNRNNDNRTNQGNRSYVKGKQVNNRNSNTQNNRTNQNKGNYSKERLDQQKLAAQVRAAIRAIVELQPTVEPHRDSTLALMRGQPHINDDLILAVALSYKLCNSVFCTGDKNLLIKAKGLGLRVAQTPDELMATIQQEK